MVALLGAACASMSEQKGGMSATDSKAADLRSALNGLLQEHATLAAAATNAALGGRQAEFQAAAGALDQNSQDLAKAIGSVYGQGAQDAFLPLWRKHIGWFVDYTVGTATKDQAKQEKAVNDLVGYTQDFGAFLASANENLPADVVAGLVKGHVLSLKDVIDAQKAGNPVAHFAAVRMAGAHMAMIGDPLAEATVVKFPDKFGGAAADHSQTMPGHSMSAPAKMDAEIRQFAFRPAAIEVPVGSAITWWNQDGAQHSVTDRGGAFDSGLFAQGGSFTYTFDRPGQYAYYCTRHQSMQGTVTVS
jgi:plastocyanin